MLPYRPVPLSYNKGQLNLQVNLKDKTSTSDTVNVIVNPGSNWTGKFKIVKNQPFDWIVVEPAAGVFQNGKPVCFSVKADPDKIKKAGLQKGLFLARLGNGFSVPVTVYATASNGDRAIVKVADGADFATGSDPKCTSGKYYNFDKESWDAPGQKAVEFSVEIPSAGIYYVFLRVKAPAAPGAEYNSGYIAVDGETPQKIFFENSTDWAWASVRFPNNKREPGTALNLVPGKHSIKIYPRKTMLLDTIAVSSDQVL
jgi:hypothetical protein